MGDYTLQLEAENDLLEIGRYTAKTWGLEQAERYLTQLHQHLQRIADAGTSEKPVFENRADLRVTRCRHHYVFFLREDSGEVLVMAILHEKMDMINRLRQRLGEGL